MKKIAIAIMAMTISTFSFADMSFGIKGIVAPKYIGNDWDGDGIPNSEDLDDDNDGIPDLSDKVQYSREGHRKIKEKVTECYGSYIYGSYQGERDDTYIYYSNGSVMFNWKRTEDVFISTNTDPVSEETSVTHNGYKYWKDLDDIVYQQTRMIFTPMGIQNEITNYYGICRVEI